MNENEPKKTGASVEVEIPQLKAQKKEKKGAGVVLPGAQGAGNAAVAGGAGIAQAAGGKLGFAALLSGKAGVAALVVGVGGAGLVGFGVMSQGDSAQVRKPELGGLSSSISVGKRNAKGSKSLSFMSKAGEGELRWDDPNAPKKAAPKQEEASEEELADAASSPSQEELMEQMGIPTPETAGKERPTMGRMDAKLSTELGNSSAFGSKSIFSGGTGFDVARMKKGPTNAPGADSRKMSARGKVGNLRRARGKLTGKNLSTRGAKSNRAMGQLKFAGRRSNQAAQTNSAGAAATYAEDAFGATSTEGGELEGGGAIGEDMPTIQPPGSGAPGSGSGGGGGGTCPSNWTVVEGGGCEPPDLEGVNATPYQGLVENAKQMSDQAAKLKIVAYALIAIGIGLLFVWPWGTVIGVLLIALGGMLLGMAQSMSSQAENMGKQVANQYGQKEQGKIIEREGSNSVNPNDSHERNINIENSAHDDIEEEKNSNYTLEE